MDCALSKFAQVLVEVKTCTITTHNNYHIYRHYIAKVDCPANNHKVSYNSGNLLSIITATAIVLLVLESLFPYGSTKCTKKMQLTWTAHRPISIGNEKPVWIGVGISVIIHMAIRRN